MTISELAGKQASTVNSDGRDRSQSADRTIEVLLLLARRGPFGSPT